MLEKTHDALFDLFMLIRNKTGWLADCVEAGFSEDDIEHLERFSVDLHGYNPDDEVADWDRQIEREGGADVYFAENEDDKIKLLSEKIAGVYRDYERSMWNDEPYADRAIRLAVSGVDRMEKLRRGIRGRQLHKDEMEKAKSTPGYVSDRISDQDIERARLYPLERLIPDFDMARAGYVRCRWHEDKKPSMLVKNGFGYCFTCAKSVDSIRWLMEVDNMGFIDAVKYLRGKG